MKNTKFFLNFARKFTKSSKPKQFKPRMARPRVKSFTIGPDNAVNKELREVTLPDSFKNKDVGRAEYDFRKCSEPSVETYTYVINKFLEFKETLLAVNYIKELDAKNVDSEIIKGLVKNTRDKSKDMATLSRMDDLNELAAKFGLPGPKTKK